MLELFNPPLPPSHNETTVLVAQAGSTSSGRDVRSRILSFDRVYEQCYPVGNDAGQGSLTPGGTLYLHWNNFPHQKIGNGSLRDAKVTILEYPKFGTLGPQRLSVEYFGPAYDYFVKPDTPNGTEDRAVFLLEIGGKKIKVIERIIIESNIESVQQCDGKNFYIRRLSYLESADPMQPLSYAELNPWLALQNAAGMGVQFNWSNLPGTTLGLTQGEGASATITLDDTAAGYGWYVDPTHLDN